jgi:hypothetical protein
MCIAFTLLFFIGHAQNLTGIWRGYFYSGNGFNQNKFKYELQLNELPNKAVKGVTYSYRSISFYGKAAMQGIYTESNKNLLIQETKMIDTKILDGSSPCIMTCYLDYYKMDGKEVLEGTFSSVNTSNKTDCGGGNVYLERVNESDFGKEDFLLHQPKKQQAPPTASNQLKKAAPSQLDLIKPRSKTDINDSIMPVMPQNQTTPTQPQVITKTPIQVPDLIRQRDNPLVKTIITSSPDIKIQLYDNGEIDGDTITVFHNNELVINRKGLSKEPITLNVKADSENTHHEFIMVANNLGSIPPNTALMVVTTGGKRYELFISSDEQRNAKVVIEYKIPGKDTK